MIKICLYCGKKLERKDKRDYVWNLKKFCNRRCKELYRHKNNTDTKELRKEQQKIRRFTYNNYRDKLGDKCQICGSKENLEIHHKNYTDFSIENCQLVCRNCHRHKIHNF